MSCEFCQPYTDHPLMVLLGDTLTVQFNYCPNCGRKLRPPKPPTDLTGKCGSCEYAAPYKDVHGAANCYVKCTNREHVARFNSRWPSSQVRQRTTKACKKYVPRTKE